MDLKKASSRKSDADRKVQVGSGNSLVTVDTASDDTSDGGSAEEEEEDERKEGSSNRETPVKAEHTGDARIKGAYDKKEPNYTVHFDPGELGLEMHTDTFVIHGVVPGSMAERLGVECGSRVVSVNGVVPDSYDHFAKLVSDQARRTLVFSRPTPDIDPESLRKNLITVDSASAEEEDESKEGSNGLKPPDVAKLMSSTDAEVWDFFDAQFERREDASKKRPSVPFSEGTGETHPDSATEPPVSQREVENARANLTADLLKAVSGHGILGESVLRQVRNNYEESELLLSNASTDRGSHKEDDVCEKYFTQISSNEGSAHTATANNLQLKNGDVFFGTKAWRVSGSKFSKTLRSLKDVTWRIKKDVKNSSNSDAFLQSRPEQFEVLPEHLRFLQTRKSQSEDLSFEELVERRGFGALQTVEYEIIAFCEVTSPLEFRSGSSGKKTRKKSFSLASVDKPLLITTQVKMYDDVDRSEFVQKSQANSSRSEYDEMHHPEELRYLDPHKKYVILFAELNANFTHIFVANALAVDENGKQNLFHSLKKKFEYFDLVLDFMKKKSESRLAQRWTEHSLLDAIIKGLRRVLDAQVAKQAQQKEHE